MGKHLAFRVGAALFLNGECMVDELQSTPSVCYVHTEVVICKYNYFFYIQR